MDFWPKPEIFFSNKEIRELIAVLKTSIRNHPDFKTISNDSDNKNDSANKNEDYDYTKTQNEELAKWIRVYMYMKSHSYAIYANNEEYVNNTGCWMEGNDETCNTHHHTSDCKHCYCSDSCKNCGQCDISCITYWGSDNLSSLEQSMRWLCAICALKTYIKMLISLNTI